MTQQTQEWTIRRLLEWTTGFFSRKDVDPARLSAELLLSHVLNVPRIKLYTDYERTLSERHLAELLRIFEEARHRAAQGGAHRNPNSKGLANPPKAA